MLPRPYRSTLSQLRSGYCSRLQSYLHRVGRAPSPACPDCGSAPHTTEHLFSCPESPTDLAPRICGRLPCRQPSSFPQSPLSSDLPPFPVIPGGPFPPPAPLPNLRRSRAPRPHTHTEGLCWGGGGRRVAFTASVLSRVLAKFRHTLGWCSAYVLTQDYADVLGEPGSQSVDETITNGAYDTVVTGMCSLKCGGVELLTAKLQMH